MPRKLTLGDFIEKANKKHNNKYGYDQVKFTKNTDKIIILCPVHNYFEQKVADHLSGRGCRKCNKSCKMSKEDFIKKSKEAHGDKYSYDKVEYKSSKIKVTITCPIHGDFNQEPTSHLSGNGCCECGYITTAAAKTLTTIDFVKYSILVHGDKYDYTKSKYIGRFKKITIICPNHGAFQQTPNNHYQGKGCSKCNDSWGERVINVELTKRNIKFVTQKKFDTCVNIFKLSFDVYLTEYNALIEFDGLQHFTADGNFGNEIEYKKRIHRDLKKDQWCRDNNISLIRISYTDIKTLPIFLDKYLDILKSKQAPKIYATPRYNELVRGYEILTI